ncbi:MAG: SRPBCC family protein [Propylenella sp.]
MKAAVKDDRVLKLERRLKAKPEKVFAAWTEPAQVANWFGPEGMTIPKHKIDARVGGGWTVTMRDPKGNDRTVSGVYREVERPKRLAFTWAWHNEGKRGHETEVVVEFKPDGDGTLMRLTQKTFGTAHDRDMHNMGWGSSLKGLARLVEA